MSRPAGKRPADDDDDDADRRQTKKAKGEPASAVVTVPLLGGGRYVGQVNGQSKPHGEGTKYRADGSKQASGQWRNGKLHGRGKMSFNGDSYEGDFVNEQMCGLGAYTYADGGVFEGEFGGSHLANGFGIHWTAEGKVAKCGRWVNDKLVEPGPVPLSKIPFGKFLSAAVRAFDPDRTLLLSNGGHYVGEIGRAFRRKGHGHELEPKEEDRMYRPHGFGVEYRADGTETACGHWRNGEQHGDGWKLMASGDRYEGHFSLGLPSRKGKIKYQSGDDREYEGDFAGGLRNGLGKLTLLDGSVYQGEFARGERSGLGVLWDKDGRLAACGRWDKDKLVERGRVPRSRLPAGVIRNAAANGASLLFPDGSFFCGKFNAQFRRHGAGTMHSADGAVPLTGEWSNDRLISEAASAAAAASSPAAAPLAAATAQRRIPWLGGKYVGQVNAQQQPHGQGTLFRSDESERMRGQWRCGKLHGLARWTRSDSSVLEGEFAENECSGLGIQWDSDRKVVQYGRWEKNRLVEERPVPCRKIPFGKNLPAADEDRERTLLLTDGSHYVGRFNEDFRQHGEGTHYCADGSEVASGQWRNGKMHGRGKVILPDGDRYEGEFVDDKRNGLGACTCADGSVHEGEWTGGKPNGFGIKWNKNGKVLKCGRWADGKLVESCAVPRSKIPSGTFLSAAAKLAALICPGGGHYCGALNGDNEPHGAGALFRADGSEAVRGDWIGGRLWVSGARDAQNRLQGAGSEWSTLGLYVGNFVDGQRSGKGTTTSLIGHRFEGEWADGKRNGLGKLTWNAGGDVFVGEFSNNKVEGFGVRIKNGAVVGCGRWENDRLAESRPVPRSKLIDDSMLSAAARAADPERSLLLPGGGHYVGEFNADFRQHGEGVEFRANGSEVASGEWRDGKPLGRGKMILSNGECYEGNFVDGKFSGLGTFTWADGEMYEGEFSKGDFNGFGVQWSAGGKVVACGRWVNDEVVKSCPVPLNKIPTGVRLSAAVRAADPDSVLLLPHGGHFEGDFNADFQPHGEGTEYYADGSEAASGQWRDGKLHGHGKKIFSKGGCYEGDFVNGQMDGLGTLVMANGFLYEGEFVADRRKGFGIKWSKLGTLVLCGRWDGQVGKRDHWIHDELVESRSVPRSKIPVGVFLLAAAKESSLLFPDRGFYRGEVNERFQRHGKGSMHAADGSIGLEVGDWINDALQSPASVPNPAPIASAAEGSNSSAAAAASPVKVSSGRKALLVGNNKYEKPQKRLECCINDVEDVSDALEKLNFECTLLVDADHCQMTCGIHDFIESLQPNDIVFIHFSGHGAESQGRTYLLPTDFGRGQLRDRAVCLEDMQHDLNDKNCHLVNIIMLDCCRFDKQDGTFRGHRSADASRSPGDSFARKPTTGQFIIAYSSDRGTVAHEDIAERNGWFTACVLKHLTTPGLILEQIFKRANRDLKAKSDHTQRSWIHLTMDDDVVLCERM